MRADPARSSAQALDGLPMGMERHRYRPGDGHCAKTASSARSSQVAALAVQAAALGSLQECGAGRISIPMASIEPRRLAAPPGTAGETTYGLPAVTGDERILPDWGEAVSAAGTGGPRSWR
jgi:hypothetical protein